MFRRPVTALYARGSTGPPRANAMGEEGREGERPKAGEAGRDAWTVPLDIFGVLSETSGVCLFSSSSWRMLAKPGICVPVGILNDCLDNVGRLFRLLFRTTGASLSLPESSSTAELVSASLPVSLKFRFFGLCPRVRDEDLDKIGADDELSSLRLRPTALAEDDSVGGADP